MVATWNVAASGSYYMRGTEYFLGNREPDGVWYAPRGDFDRVDTEVVEPKDFAALYERKSVMARCSSPMEAARLTFVSLRLI